MKTSNCHILLACVLILISACNLTENTDDLGNLEEFQIVRNGELILDLTDIDFYDFSSHILYLNENNRLNGDFEKLHGSVVVVDGQEIYPLKIQDLTSSNIQTGPQIYRMMDMFGDFAFRIRFISFEDGATHVPNDPRKDVRIRSVFKKHQKLREGLSLEILSVSKTGTEINTVLSLKNLDPFPYYHLDPSKMGKGLFHYFTNGLTFYNPLSPQYVYDKNIRESPEPWDYWTKDWLSEIKGNQSKTLEFTYNLGPVPSGSELKFTFDFPSLERSLKVRSDLDMGNGKIWLGNVTGEKEQVF
ncbi:hypothetical protein [Pararhodonellum marinum]|uniref:hypothetical protein n=1 Tax=Pararhodonellum marinum TaxID=2755358 RepID=UPI00188F5290|nr:hypothetical protein [Pararhodonellum marinum]